MITQSPLRWLNVVCFWPTWNEPFPRKAIRVLPTLSFIQQLITPPSLVQRGTCIFAVSCRRVFVHRWEMKACGSRDRQGQALQVFILRLPVFFLLYVCYFIFEVYFRPVYLCRVIFCSSMATNNLKNSIWARGRLFREADRRNRYLPKVCMHPPLGSVLTKKRDVPVQAFQKPGAYACP